MWYPCGSFKGDEKSAALCENYASNGLLSSISKNQLDITPCGKPFVRNVCAALDPNIAGRKEENRYSMAI